MNQPSSLHQLSHCHFFPWAHVTLPLLFSYSQSTKSALISYAVLLSEVGSIYEEEKDFNVEKTSLVSSLTHTIKMSPIYILLESLWNPQNCMWHWADNYKITHEARREHIPNNPSLKARLSTCLAFNSWRRISTWCSPPAGGGEHRTENKTLSFLPEKAEERKVFMGSVIDSLEWSLHLPVDNNRLLSITSPMVSGCSPNKYGDKDIELSWNKFCSSCFQPFKI